GDRRLLVLSEKAILILTTPFRHYGNFPVVMEVLPRKPRADPKRAWDHIEDARLDVPTGSLAIDGPIGYRPETRALLSGERYSPHFSLPPGRYDLRVFYGAQETCDEDYYWIRLWPR